jgi:cell division protein FtsL
MINKKTVIKITSIILMFAFCFYLCIEKQNQFTSKRIEIVGLAKEIDQLKAQNKKLSYEIDQFENPSRLLQLAQHAEYAHLKHPFVKDVLSMKENMLAHREVQKYNKSKKTALSIALGAK